MRRWLAFLREAIYAIRHSRDRSSMVLALLIVVVALSAVFQLLFRESATDPFARLEQHSELAKQGPIERAGAIAGATLTSSREAAAVEPPRGNAPGTTLDRRVGESARQAPPPQTEVPGADQTATRELETPPSRPAEDGVSGSAQAERSLQGTDLRRAHVMSPPPPSQVASTPVVSGQAQKGARGALGEHAPDVATSTGPLVILQLRAFWDDASARNFARRATETGFPCIVKRSLTSTGRMIARVQFREPLNSKDARRVLAELKKAMPDLHPVIVPTGH